MAIRPYQARGITDIFKAWETHDVVMFVMPTGSGKTVISMDVIKFFLHQGYRTKFIAHREELINQGWATFFEQNIYSGIIQASVTVMNYKGMAYKVNDTTLPSQICSIQTIQRRNNLPPAQLIVIDEGHHVTASNGYGKVLQQYPDAKVLIVTATPYRLSGESFEEVVKGKQTRLIVNSTLRDLIIDGWLCPLDYHVPFIPNLDDIDMSKGEYEEESARKAMELAPVVENYLEIVNGMQGICFAVDVVHSKALTKKFLDAGVPAAHLDANTPDDDSTDEAGHRVRGRKSIIADFISGIIKVVCNVGIFTEGTDFPNCQFVIDAAPTKSLSKFLQKVGRATRPLKSICIDNYPTSELRKQAISESDKPYAIILDCCGAYIDHGMPDKVHDWEHYFYGRHKTQRGKKAKDEGEFETMTIEIFEAEDAQGNIIRTTKAKEIEGLKLIRITEEVKRKVINIKCIKEFDRLFAVMKADRKKKNAGRAALEAFCTYCERHQIFMAPEIWDYLIAKLYDQVHAEMRQLVTNRSQFPTIYTEAIVNATMNKLQGYLVEKDSLERKRRQYFKINEIQYQEYILRNV